MPVGRLNLEGRTLPSSMSQDSGVADATSADIKLSRAGIALPRIARRREPWTSRHLARGHRARDEVSYSVRSFTARSASARAVLDAVFRLRARVFVHELGWLLPGVDDREHDRCDGLARHFALFARVRGGREATLAGYARVLLPHQGFMLEREFAELLDGERLASDAGRAFEVSRVVTDPRFRGVCCREGRMVTEHLGRAIARWALAHGREHCYTVCEARHTRALRLRGLCFSQVGRTLEYQSGVEVCAAMLDIAATGAGWRTERPEDYAWYLGRSQQRAMP
jgi:N-acyl-L-homoserine lactone synthetase